MAAPTSSKMFKAMEKHSSRLWHLETDAQGVASGISGSAVSPEFEALVQGWMVIPTTYCTRDANGVWQYKEHWHTREEAEAQVQAYFDAKAAVAVSPQRSP